MLIALAVLAMSVGLVRRESAGHLRTLAATGASGLTRRTITNATAAALALTRSRARLGGGPAPGPKSRINS